MEDARLSSTFSTIESVTCTNVVSLIGYFWILIKRFEKFFVEVLMPTVCSLFSTSVFIIAKEGSLTSFCLSKSVTMTSLSDSSENGVNAKSEQVHKP